MPKIALADTLDDWEQLLRAAEPYADLKGLRVHLAGLETALDRLRELDALRSHLQAQRQAATQELNEIRVNGKVMAIEIRSLLKAILGHRNEGLVQFRIRPRRSGYRKKKSPATQGKSVPAK